MKCFFALAILTAGIAQGGFAQAPNQDFKIEDRHLEKRDQVVKKAEEIRPVEGGCSASKVSFSEYMAIRAKQEKAVEPRPLSSKEEE